MARDCPAAARLGSGTSDGAGGGCLAPGVAASCQTVSAGSCELPNFVISVVKWAPRDASQVSFDFQSGVLFFFFSVLFSKVGLLFFFDGLLFSYFSFTFSLLSKDRKRQEKEQERTRKRKIRGARDGPGQGVLGQRPGCSVSARGVGCSLRLP